jgi:hypothetical protein
MDTKVHELKTDPYEFNSTAAGIKLSEVRFDDRGYQQGHYLLLRETKYTGIAMRDDPSQYPLTYTGYHIMAQVTHIHERQGMQDSWKVMSIKVLSKATRRTHGC